MLSAQSATEDYIRAEHKLHSISKSFISQVMFFEPVYILPVLDMGTCIQQGDLLYSAGLHRTGVSHSQHRKKKTRRCFGKNAGEWSRRVEISKEEIPGNKRSMYSYVLTYSRL